jgi:hypothetical protein
MKRALFCAIVLATLVGATSCGDDDSTDDVGDAGDHKDAGTCGNNKVEGTELCDGTDLNHETCATVGDGIYTSGTLNCTDQCHFDLSMCTGKDAGETSYMNDGGGGTGG